YNKVIFDAKKIMIKDASLKFSDFLNYSDEIERLSNLIENVSKSPNSYEKVKRLKYEKSEYERKLILYRKYEPDKKIVSDIVDFFKLQDDLDNDIEILVFLDMLGMENFIPMSHIINTVNGMFWANKLNREQIAKIKHFIVATYIDRNAAYVI